MMTIPIASEVEVARAMMDSPGDIKEVIRKLAAERNALRAAIAGDATVEYYTEQVKIS